MKEKSCYREVRIHARIRRVADEGKSTSVIDRETWPAIGPCQRDKACNWSVSERQGQRLVNVRETLRAIGQYQRDTDSDWSMPKRQGQ